MKVGINGFGRIGKCVYKVLVQNGIEVPLVNDPFLDIEYLEYIIRYDSVYGRLDCTREGDSIRCGNSKTKLSTLREPSEIPWEEHGVEYVVESTGLFLAAEQCGRHRARHVLLTAPSKDIPMVVYGVNDKQFEFGRVLSAASCTTNCVAPVVKLLDDCFGIVEGYMTTVHSVTASQKVTDAKGPKWRSSRSAQNIIPATTGATNAVVAVMPQLKDKLAGMAFRVPTLDVSVVDLTVKLAKGTSIGEVVSKIREKADARVLGVVEDEVVSSDLIGDTRSGILDVKASMALSPTFLKLVVWYDNEFGYSNRIYDLLKCLDGKSE